MSETLQNLLSELKRHDISDPRVLDAMGKIPRDRFISDDGLKDLAFDDRPLPIECDQTISQPFIVAYMSERLNVSPDHDVLEIGTGSGYQTAILSQLARHVYSIERHKALHDLAVQRFAGLDLRNITAIVGDGAEGWPGGGQFDRILVTARAEHMPTALLEQLAPCGAMVIPLGPRHDQRITLVTRMDGRIEQQSLISVKFVALVS